jgi:hypothetical protein
VCDGAALIPAAAAAAEAEAAAALAAAAVLRSPDGLWEGRETRHGAMVFPGWAGDLVGQSLRSYGEYSEAEVERERESAR